MPIYAKIIDGAIVEERQSNIVIPASQIRKIDGKPVLRVVDITKPIVDNSTEVMEGPVDTILATKVNRVFSKRDKTAQELDDEKAFTVDAMDILLLKVSFNQENRIRALESKAPITVQQFKNALKGLL